ncbi:MAG: efflux transporter outer membrane subunit [Ignavibacteriota bacterium]
MKAIGLLFIALLSMLLCLCGCTLSPKYSQPKLPVPPTWPGGANSNDQPDVGTPGAPNMKWADFFTDGNLRQVIEVALANNRDLRVAALNVEKVQALYRIQRAEQFPTVNASVSGDLYRLPRTATIGGFSVPQATTVQQYTVNVGAASWELDLFGRVRSLKSQALEQYLATEQARTASQISLVAEVASAYLTMGADRDSLRLAQATLDAQQASYELIRRSREVGIANDLDLREAQTQVETARVDIARFTGHLELDENALDLLAGASVSASLLPGGLGPDEALKDIGAGLPSTVLLQRPDILSAEHQLKGAYANIGTARAAYFPRIALTGGAGFTSGDLTNLFKGASGTWSFAPEIDVPIFDAGTRKANLRAAEVDRDAAIAEYEKAIQTAFREVSDSLSQRTWLMQQQTAQQALVRALEETYRLADARYKAGIDSYLTVLVAQRSLYAGQQGLLNLREARLRNLVTLYKVLGGGA